MFHQVLDHSRRQPRAARGWVPLAGLAAMLGATGLMFATGSHTPGATDLTHLAHAWTAPQARADAGLARLPQRPLVGDEGFWLSRDDLAGSTASGVKLGDRISIASPGEATAAPTRTFEVVELKPLHDAHAGLSPTSNSGQSAVLTMVVAREIDTSATTPRVLRFLVEGATSLTPTPATPDATRVPLPARTL